MSDERDDAGDLPALVTAAQAGDSDAYAALVLRFQDMALIIGHAMLGDAHRAQDAAQDAFIDAWQSLHMLREPAAFAGWFRRIVIKHVDRQLRAGQREWPMDEARELADEISLSDSIEAIYARERVQAAMAALSRRQQQLADLFYLQDYSQQDIVSALDLPLSSVKKGLFLARKRLREEMRGMAALGSDEDGRDVERARRLHAFFSQPLAVAEMYTNLLGETVPLRETLDGVEAILAGAADAVPEEKLRFIGKMVRLIHR